MKKILSRLALCGLALLVSSPIFAEKAVLLVSLGMPDNALRAYLKQGAEAKIPVVIRGLYTDKQNQPSHPYVGGFKDTANRVKKVMGEEQVGGVSIDPTLFRAFGVKVVPALVIYDERQSCLEKSNHSTNNVCPTESFDVAFGNLSLKKLLTRISQQSKSHKRAALAQSLIFGTGNIGTDISTDIGTKKGTGKGY
jgi:type-F conjugative transfer system pilin assembly protein TrbC